MASYNVFQQVFSLSQMSNVLFSARGTTATLQTAAEKGLQFFLPFSGGGSTPNPAVAPLIGDWTVVWGPVVWKDKPDDASTGPSNTIFVAHCKQVSFGTNDVRDTYVVAMAGTAVHSVFDIVSEDAGVSTVVSLGDWLGAGGWSTTAAPPSPNAVAITEKGKPYIDNGTARGVWALLANPVPQDGVAVGGGTYLAAFLAGLPSASTVILTGHSLGGALSPTLATVLQQNGWLPGYANGNVLVYPTAGASPGNPDFATLYNTTFPIPKGSPVNASYQVWNAVLWNQLDVVPHAWADQSSAIDGRYMGAIPGLYGNSALSLKKGDAATYAEAVSVVGLASAKKNPTCNFTPLQGNMYASTYVTPIPSSGTVLSTPPSSFDEFGTEAMFQHIARYNIEIGIDLPKPTTEPAPAAAEPATA
ncbi:MAG TPA: hypothetical protein VGE72_17430 [Azospirillum sp.]